MQNLKTQGFILIDVDVVALNNAGKDNSSTNENAVATKKVTKNGRTFTYVSGQAWRYWWRNTLEKHFNWSLSPITRESKVAFTAADPIQYADDDIFGYMRAGTSEKLDEKGNVVVDNKGKPKTENVTVTRISPLKNSAIVSVTSVQVEKGFSSMARHDGDSVPYVKEEYSAIMKGMFALDFEQAGTFATYNKTGFKNLTELLQKAALESGAKQINDPFVKKESGEPQQLVRLARETRVKRITETIKALKFISGGAMQTNNMGDVTPKFIILSTMTTGNHPFTHIVGSGVEKRTFVFNHDGLKEVLEDYKDQFVGNIYIGVRNGFLDRLDEEGLSKLTEAFKNVKKLSINEAIDAYCNELQNYIE